MVIALNASSVSYKYPSDKTDSPDSVNILSNLQFNLNKGEILYVRGESGGGKSTLLRLMNRLIEPDTGSLELYGIDYQLLDVLELRRRVQLVPQTPSLLQGISVRENLLLAAPEATDESIKKLTGAFNLPPEILEKRGGEVSVGQAQRLCVIRALLLKPEIILLDEPTASLDPGNRENFQKTFLALQQETGFSAIWVTHDELHISNGDNRILHLNKGSQK